MERGWIFEEVFGSVADDFDVGKAEQRKIVAGEVAKMLIALDINESVWVIVLRRKILLFRKFGNCLDILPVMLFYCMA